MSASASWTRMAFLAHGQNRADADNRCTVAGVRAPIGQFPPARPDVAAARLSAASMMEDLMGKLTKPGVALVAVDRHGTVAGTLTLASRASGINAGVIGRHGRCDLYLAGDDQLSLRHASIIVDEHGSYRFIDLRTGSGLRDAAGRRHDGVASTEEAVVAIGDHVVVARARRDPDLGGPMRSPWAPPLALGTKIHDDAPPSGPGPHATGSGAIGARNPADDAAARMAITITGPITRTGGALLGSDESRLAILELADAGSREQWPVGERALSNGILLGRYERCDGHGSRILARRGISRVHAIVLAVDGAPYVLDLGSTNGTWIDGTEIKCARIAPGATIRLGERGPSIIWRAAS
jgi:hypothetical protein